MNTTTATTYAEVKEKLAYYALNRQRNDKQIADAIILVCIREQDADKQERLIHDLAHAYAKAAKINRRPARKKNPTPWQWVAYATDPKDVFSRGFKYVHVTTDYIEATDGKRLHRIDNTTDMKPGFYTTDGTFVEDLDKIPYPNTDRVIVDRNDYDTKTTFSCAHMEARSTTENNKPFVELIVPATGRKNDRIIYGQSYAVEACAGSVAEMFYQSTADNEVYDRTTARILSTRIEPSNPELRKLNAFVMLMPRVDNDN